MKIIITTYCFVILCFIPTLIKANDKLVEQKKLHTKLNHDKNLVDSLETIRTFILFFSDVNIDSAKSYFNKAAALIKRSNNSVLKASFYSEMANAYWYSNDFKNAMDFYLKELRIGDSIKNYKIIGDSKYNIGWIKCLQLKQYKSVNYFYEALQIFILQKDSVHIIQLYEALGNYYKTFNTQYKNANDSCLKYYLSSAQLFVGASFQKKAANSYANLAEYYSSIKQFIIAKQYSLKGLLLAKLDDDEYSYVNNSNLLAECYMNLDSLKQSKKILEVIANKLSNPVYENIRLNTYFIYYNIYKKEKDFKKAFEYSLKYKNLSDSINEKTFNQNLLQKESDYKLEKKDKELSELQLKNQLQNVKNKHNSYIILGLIIFGILVLIILYFLFKSNKQKQQTNSLLSKQNEIINEKNIEIKQSMQYASRIQNALMPTQKYIISNLNRLKNKL